MLYVFNLVLNLIASRKRCYFVCPNELGHYDIPHEIKITEKKQHVFCFIRLDLQVDFKWLYKLS